MPTSEQLRSIAPHSNDSFVFQVFVDGVSYPQQVIVRNGMRILDVVAHLALQHKMTSFVVSDSSERALSLNMRASDVGGERILLLKSRICDTSRVNSAGDCTDGSGPPVNETQQQSDTPALTHENTAAVELPVPSYLRTAEQQLVKEELFLKNLETLLDHYCPLLEKYVVFSMDEFETLRCWLSNTHHFVKLMHDKLSEFIKYYSDLSAHQRANTNVSPSTTTGVDFWSTASTNSSSAGSKMNTDAGGSSNSSSPLMAAVNATTTNLNTAHSNTCNTSKLSSANNISPPSLGHRIQNYSADADHRRTPCINDNNINYSNSNDYNYLQSSDVDRHPQISECLNRNLWQTLYSYISNFNASQKGINRALECNKEFYNACQSVRGTSKQSLLSLLHRPVQKLSEYNKWLEELCYATPVASAEYNSLTSHAAFLARLLAQQNKSAMPTIQSAIPKENPLNNGRHSSQGGASSNKKLTHPTIIQKDSIISRLKPLSPHLTPAPKESHRPNGITKPSIQSSISSAQHQHSSSSNPSSKSSGNTHISPTHNSRNTSTNLTVAAVKRNARRRGPAHRLRRKSLDLELAMKGGVSKVNDPADESSYDGGKFILQSTIKLVHKNSITDCCLFLYEYNLAVAQMMDSENALDDENVLLQIRYDVPITDIWIAAPPNEAMGALSKSVAIDDGTSDVSLLIGWPIINVKFIFQSVDAKDAFLDHLLVAIERSLYSPFSTSNRNSPDSTMEDTAGNQESAKAASTMPIIVHNEFTTSSKSDKSSANSTAVNSHSSPKSRGSPILEGITSLTESRPNHSYNITNTATAVCVSAITNCDVDPLCRVDVLIDQICRLAEPQPCCAWIRYGKKNSSDYMVLNGYERLYPIVNYCYQNVKYSKKKSGSFSPCHLYITKYGKYPSDHPECKEKLTQRKISMSTLLPGSGNISKRKLSLGSPTNFSGLDHVIGFNSSHFKVESSGDAKFGVIDETAIAIDPNTTNAIFGCPLSEICVNSLPPMAIRELLYAIYVKCPTVQGVFRIPCGASKKQEFKSQLDAGHLPKDWLSSDLQPNLLCDTLKDFLQNIPGGVFGMATKDLMKSHSKGFLHFKETLLNIPVVNYQLLVRVMYVLAACLKGQATALAPEKRLNLDGLVICIAPTIFRDATHEMIHATKPNGKNTFDVKKLLSFVMENREDLFADFWPLIASEFDKASKLLLEENDVFLNEEESRDSVIQRTQSLSNPSRIVQRVSSSGDTYRPALPYKQNHYSPTDLELMSINKRATSSEQPGSARHPEFNTAAGTGIQRESPYGNSVDSGIETAVTNDGLNETSPSLMSSNVANVRNFRDTLKRDPPDFDADLVSKSAVTREDLPLPPFRQRIPMPPMRNTSHIDDRSRLILANEAKRKIHLDFKQVPFDQKSFSQTHTNNLRRAVNINSSPSGNVFATNSSKNSNPGIGAGGSSSEIDETKLNFAVRRAPVTKSACEMSFRSNAFLCDVCDSDEECVPQFV